MTASVPLCQIATRRSASCATSDSITRECSSSSACRRQRISASPSALATSPRTARGLCPTWHRHPAPARGGGPPEGTGSLGQTSDQSAAVRVVCHTTRTAEITQPVQAYPRGRRSVKSGIGSVAAPTIPLQLTLEPRRYRFPFVAARWSTDAGRDLAAHPKHRRMVATHREVAASLALGVRTL